MERLKERQKKKQKKKDKEGDVREKGMERKREKIKYLIQVPEVDVLDVEPVGEEVFGTEVAFGVLPGFVVPMT
jgi:hypothetical protein